MAGTKVIALPSNDMTPISTKGIIHEQKQGYRKFQIVELDLDKEVGETEPI